ncbi:MAG TPA: YggS family pyridoxal phosphate-dependent enzyme [Lentisphaeria bacterium]|nr:MAG: YggS family pyridoxal phosphate enzyme [Lentisphaerae bacterium GWF2_38_69]HBM15530.1 YggS family pyridoxal phosphate-dependent enzyme [Lentisphaeria bacterium]
MENYIEANLHQIKNEICITAESSHRSPDSIKLLVVSKNFSVENIMKAYEAGQRMFGENKVQELESKAPNLPKDIEWHLIGHLQSNKVAKAVELAEYIHSVDSEKLIKRIDRISYEKNKVQKILLEINISDEESKFGLNLANIDKCIELALKCKSVNLVGLMTMAPFEADELELNKIFATLNKKKNDLEDKYKINLPELSMGMSGDFKTAIANGSTIVRIGTAVFGRRIY